MLTLARRAQVASALQLAGGAISGEVLAQRLGISRVAVSNHVAALRALGYVIESAPRAGYRLIQTPDLCIPEEVAPLLADQLWVRCEGSPEVRSTNDEAKTLARSGAAEGTVFVAARQTQGRGRFDRSWESPTGGAYLSAVLRPPVAPSAIAPVSLVVALGAGRALARAGVPVSLKWPNDLEADSRKVGGVLLEMAAEADRVEWLVVGIGINVTNAGSADSASADATRADRAWVREHAPNRGVAEVAATVLDGLADAYREWLRTGFEPMRAEYESMLTLMGEDVVVRNAAGVAVAEGVVTGIDATGALLLAVATGTIAVNAGEVTLRG